MVLNVKVGEVKGAPVKIQFGSSLPPLVVLIISVVSIILTDMYKSFFFRQVTGMLEGTIYIEEFCLIEFVGLKAHWDGSQRDVRRRPLYCQTYTS